MVFDISKLEKVGFFNAEVRKGLRKGSQREDG
jgi:hypothetical protein